MSGKTRERNQARLVRCSAGCGRLCWLAGALPTSADPAFVCASCRAAEGEAEMAEMAVCGTVDEGTGAVCTRPGVHTRHAAIDQDVAVSWTEAAS